jgi:hypothetical protein
MTDRLIGPTGSKRRKRFLFAPALLVALAAMFWIAGAQAVHDINVFELDGNATTGAHVGLPDDWDRVCHQVTITDDTGGTITDQCASASNTTGATGLSFVSEPNRSTSIFTGGGSKDDLNILADPGPGTGWQWKNQGGLPDKDNLRDAFAARYTCVTASGCTGSAGDALLYFGADRFDNSGDAQIGFWFMQGDVSNLSGGTFGPDAHTDGDILILSDFTQGGGKPTIRIFAWDPDCSSGCNPATDLVDGTLLPLGGGTATPADCPSQGTVDPFCAVVNNGPGNTPSPWTFEDKSHNTSFAPGEFYEGGLNLTALQETFPGIASECFASFSSETRTSQATDAVLKDFIIGSFQPCESGIVTTPSNASVTIGQTVTDSAVVTGTGAGTPTGTVKFFVCSPSQLDDPTTTTDDPNTCDTDGTFVDVNGDEPNGEPLVADASDPTKANATSDLVTVNAVGTWCFRGEYVPAAGSPYSPATDAATTECFQVVTVPTTTTTRQFVYPQDKAKITASAGGALAGTVHFRLFGAAGGNTALQNCQADVLSSGTSTTGLIDNESALIDAASGNTSPQTRKTNNTTNAVSSPSGTYYWHVYYDSTNPAQDDSDPGCVENTVYTFSGDDTSITVP